MIRTLIISSFIALSACAVSDMTLPGQSDSTYQKITFSGTVATDTERKRCVSAGGTVSRAGMLQAEYCVQTPPDAGKVCANHSDCLSRCVLLDDEKAGAGEPATGTCEARDIHFGCTTLVNNGFVAGTLCVD